MDIIEILKAVVFGFVEGITEWLPISSTGHLILLDEFIHLKVTDSFIDMFRVVIQLGAIMAVVVMYWNKIFPFSAKEKYFIKKDTFVMWFKILVASIPAAVIGIFLDATIDKYFYNYQVVTLTLVTFGILFIIIENRNRHTKPQITKISELTYQSAIIIGVFQLIAAVFPGTSRSGATILGAIMIGVSRVVATEFTFFLAIPAMFGASLLKLVKFGFDFTTEEAVILFTGVVVSFAVSILAIRFLTGYIRKHNFKLFGYYRILLGGIVFIYFLSGSLSK